METEMLLKLKRRKMRIEARKHYGCHTSDLKYTPAILDF